MGAQLFKLGILIMLLGFIVMCGILVFAALS